MTSPLPLRLSDFEAIRNLVYDESAIVLETDKQYLVESRLASVLENEGLSSFGELVSRLSNGAGTDLRQRVVQAMTTNETLFFRDFTPFEALRAMVLPVIIQRRTAVRTLRILSAGCSTGQEIYSVALLLRDHFPELANWQIDLHGVDISTAAIARARRGIYSQFEVNRGLPASLLTRHFQRSGPDWAIAEEVRRMVTFEHMNLARGSSLSPSWDLIFLRNVLIYFDHATRLQVLADLRRTLPPDGIILFGAAETPIFLDTSFEPLPRSGSSGFRLRNAPGDFIRQLETIHAHVNR